MSPLGRFIVCRSGRKSRCWKINLFCRVETRLVLCEFFNIQGRSLLWRKEKTNGPALAMGGAEAAPHALFSVYGGHFPLTRNGTERADALTGTASCAKACINGGAIA